MLHTQQRREETKRTSGEETKARVVSKHHMKIRGREKVLHTEILESSEKRLFHMPSKNADEHRQLRGSSIVPYFYPSKSSTLYRNDEGDYDHREEFHAQCRQDKEDNPKWRSEYSENTPGGWTAAKEIHS